MLYLDTSSLFKFLLPLAGEETVAKALSIESAVVISQLTELEMRVQLRARRLGGDLTNAEFRRVLDRFESLKDNPPFIFRSLTGTVFSAALRQHCDTETHCRSLDRLHLAAMEDLEITRLMTHDIRQAEAARAMGFDVATP